MVVFLAFAGAGADGHLSDDSHVEEARRLIGQERFGEALGVLRERVGAQESEAHRVDVLFLLGLAAVRAGMGDNVAEREALLWEAVRAFREILGARPDLLRVRLELARALFYLNEDDAAGRHFSVALEAAPPPEVAVNVRRFLAVIEGRRRWDGYFSVAVAPSSNVNGGTDNRVIYLYGLPFVIGEEARAESGVGLRVNGGGVYAVPLSRGRRWRFGGDAGRDDYAGREFDAVRGRVWTGPEWVFGRAAVGGRVLGGQSWCGGARCARFWGVGGEARGRVAGPWRWSAGGEWRRLRRRGAPASSGHFVDGRVGLDWEAAARRAVGGRLEYAVGRPRAVGGRYRYWRGSVRASFGLGEGWGAAGGFGFGRTRFEGGAASVPGFAARRDVTRVWEAELWNAGWAVRGLVPKVGVRYERRGSNSVFHEVRVLSGVLKFSE